MANQNLFSTKSSANENLTVNEAGGSAYAFSPRHMLAQYAVTGCLNQTFYATAETQLETVLELARNPEIDDEFLAKTAVYARKSGFMKDMPALLCAVLAARKSPVLEQVFPLVIDSGKMLRTFVQIVRSGAVGRKSFGSAVRRLIRQWFEKRTDAQIFNSSIGNAPSMADVIKMVHPRPKTEERRNLFAYLLGHEYQLELLPENARQFELFKAGKTETVPQVPFQFLTSLPLSRKQWTEIALNASWQTLRMNLNTFERHGVWGEGEEILPSKPLKNKLQPSKPLKYKFQPNEPPNAFQIFFEGLENEVSANQAGRKRKRNERN